jgi:ribosomal protein S18 acetylase RimI-like enzyme
MQLATIWFPRTKAITALCAWKNGLARQSDDSLCPVTKMEIRPLTDLDAQPYQQLRAEALELEPWAFTESTREHQAMTLETIQRRLGSEASGDNFVMGAFKNGQIIAVAGFFRRQGEKICHRGEIWGVYVKREHRSKGIGRALLEELIRQLRSQPGLEQVSLGVSVGNTSAKTLYESLGFETYGHETHALKIGDTYVDEELMVLYFSR